MESSVKSASNSGRLSRSMWSDNEADIDLLGFQHLESAVTGIVRVESLLPASIGVFGDWGSGKSSLLRMVERELSKDSDALVLWFNGWLFEGFEDAKTALMGSIVDEIVSKRTLKAQGTEVAKKLSLRLLKRLQLFRLMGIGVRAATGYAVAGKAGAFASVGADSIALWNDITAKSTEDSTKAEAMSMEDVEKELKGDAGQNLRRGIREFRDDFESLLKETKISRLVVLIDDLDRCSPDTIIETLEAIKLFLFVPRTAFVIGADERLVRYAVRRRFPELPGEKVEVGRDYLEKLIQYPVRVPPLGRAEMETYINLLFAKNSNDVTPEQFESMRKAVTESKSEAIFGVRFNHAVAQKVLGRVEKDLGDNLALAERVAPILASGLLGNPRQCKRFLNTLTMRMSMAKGRGFELKQRVLVKLMLLEYFHTETFRKLAEAQAQQEGHPKELAAAEASVRPKPRVSTNADDDDNSNGHSGKAKHKRDAAGTETEEGEEAAALPPWLADPALNDWLQSEPYLAPEDLRPYYFFARDRLINTLGTSVQRMSSTAQELLMFMVEPGESALKNTLERAKTISPADAAAVLQSLAERARQEEDHGVEHSAVYRSVEWAKVRRELLGQLIAVFNDLPEDRLPPALPPKLTMLATGEPEKAMLRQLNEKWAKSTSNNALKVAAAAQLKTGQR